MHLIYVYERKCIICNEHSFMVKVTTSYNTVLVHILENLQFTLCGRRIFENLQDELRRTPCEILLRFDCFKLSPEFSLFLNTKH